MPKSFPAFKKDTSNMKSSTAKGKTAKVPAGKGMKMPKKHDCGCGGK